MAQMERNLPAMQETQVWSLGREDPLEKEIATHSSSLAWRIPWTEESGGLQTMGSQRVGHNWPAGHSTAQAYFIILNTWEIPRVWGSMSQELQTKIKHRWEIYFGHLNDQICTSCRSQDHSVTSEFIYGIPIPKGDGIRRWDLCEVISAVSRNLWNPFHRRRI